MICYTLGIVLSVATGHAIALKHAIERNEADRLTSWAGGRDGSLVAHVRGREVIYEIEPWELQP